MAARNRYRLRLPSGGTVAVCAPHPIQLIAMGVGRFALLAGALEVAGSSDDTEPESSQVDTIRNIPKVCRLVLVDRELDVGDLPWLDQLAVYHWALDAPADAIPDGTAPWHTDDLMPIIRGQGAVLLDSFCRRYALAPAKYMGIDDPMLATDLDLAITYRGVRHEHGGENGEVEAKDMFGNVYKLPSSVLPKADSGMKVIDMDVLAKYHGPGHMKIGGGLN